MDIIDILANNQLKLEHRLNMENDQLFIPLEMLKTPLSVKPHREIQAMIRKM